MKINLLENFMKISRITDSSIYSDACMVSNTSIGKLCPQGPREIPR